MFGRGVAEDNFQNFKPALVILRWAGARPQWAQRPYPPGQSNSARPDDNDNSGTMRLRW